MKEKFVNLPIQTQIVFTTIPIYVSSTENPDNEGDQQIIDRQTKFLRLPKGIRWKLASFDISDKVQLIGQKYGFELLRLANITRLVREYYFGEVRLEDFPREIEKRMGVSLLTAQEIARYIRSEIIDWDPWGEYIAKLPKLSVREIVAKYPKLADTKITAGYIELRGSEDLENPTIKNWIHDYVLHLGQAGHSQMERTRYLFHSENGQNLSSPDREKLGVILKSFDENTPLPVDEENGEIVFDIVEQKSPSSFPFRKGGEASGPFPFVKGPARFESRSESGGKLERDLKREDNKQESFIKPFPSQIPPKAENVVGKPAVPQTRPQTPPMPKISYQVTSSMPEPLPRKVIPNPPVRPPATEREGGKAEIDKFFNIPESPDIPPMKIHGFTEHDKPHNAPPVPLRPNIQSPLPPRPTSAPPQPVPRPQHRIIDPFEKRFTEPKIDGNVVDLSDK